MKQSTTRVGELPGIQVLDAEKQVDPRCRIGECRVALGQPLLGFWPVKLVRRLEMHLAAGEDRRMSTWLTIAAARTIDFGPIINVNRREDLAALE